MAPKLITRARRRDHHGDRRQGGAAADAARNLRPRSAAAPTWTGTASTCRRSAPPCRPSSMARSPRSAPPARRCRTTRSPRSSSAVPTASSGWPPCRCRIRKRPPTSCAAPCGRSACAARRSARTSTAATSTIRRSSRSGPWPNELRAFILVHPHGEIVPGDRLESYYMRNFVGLPFETTMAGAALVFGGVHRALSRHRVLPVPWRRLRAVSGRPFRARLAGARRAEGAAARLARGIAGAAPLRHASCTPRARSSS